jgi:glutaredoxin
MKCYALALVLFATSGAGALSTPPAAAAARAPNAAIKAMANGMSLLRPIFGAEAKIQAAILGSNVDEEEIAMQLQAEKKANKILVYTYALSPFSTEAVAMLDSTGYDYTKIELGAEWFLLGAEESVKRVLLSREVENGATSLPKVFIGGQCIGGCSELAEAVESGELERLVQKAGVRKPGQSQKKKLFSFL